MLTKQCTKCSNTLPTSEFHKSSWKKNGLSSWCKSCKNPHDRQYSQQYRAEHPEEVREYMKMYVASPAYAEVRKKTLAKFPEKNAARIKLREAVKRGEVSRGSCEVCGTIERIDGHHTDYSRPYDVRWFCRFHHLKIHHGMPLPQNQVEPQSYYGLRLHWHCQSQ
jgi:hypothetical protein